MVVFLEPHRTPLVRAMRTLGRELEADVHTVGVVCGGPKDASLRHLVRDGRCRKSPGRIWKERLGEPSAKLGLERASGR